MPAHEHEAVNGALLSTVSIAGVGAQSALGLKLSTHAEHGAARYRCRGRHDAQERRLRSEFRREIALSNLMLLGYERKLCLEDAHDRYPEPGV